LLDTERGDGQVSGAETLQVFLDRATAERIRTALDSVGGVRVEAARQLGVDRTTLYRLMRKYEIGGVTGAG
jgi:transcriptional regulator of acetoin/glycerol metabolism